MENHMKKSRFTETQIFTILKEGESGVMTVPDLCRKHNVGQSTYYKWKAKYGGMEQSELKRMKELEEENAKLKKMFADVSLQNVALKDIIEKKL
jgi:putative transposase